MRSDPRPGPGLIRHPFLVALPVQAALLLWHLDHLAPWTDEEMTRRVAVAPWPEARHILALDNHPPGYFWLARLWLQLPWAAEPVTALRGLSALLALASGVVVYWYWVRDRDRATRWWFAALWATSPYILLFGRMARGYTLQMLVGALAVAAAERFVRHPRRARPLVAYVAATTLLLYTHYLPGAAVIGAVALVLLWRLARERNPALLVPLLAPPLAVGIAYAPWLPNLGTSAGRLISRVPYTVTTDPLLDRLLEVAYVFVSFTYGETLPTWAVPLAVVAAPAVVWLAIAGAAARPAWAGIVALATAMAFVVAGHWVSYAFVAARLSFAYPFWLLLLVQGMARQRRLGGPGGAALLAIALAATAGYVRGEGFLNKGYLIPVDAIAAQIAARSNPADTVVLVEPHGANMCDGLRRRLPAGIPVIGPLDAAAVLAARHRALDAGVRTVWIVRGAVDRSPERWVAGLDTALADQFDRRLHEFVPYSALDHLAMRAAGWSETPTHVIDVIELHRRQVGTSSP